MLRPLNNVRDEFFETFGSKDASYKLFSKEHFEESKASLQRMLESYATDIAQKDRSFNAGEASSSMDLLLRHYEKELRHPMRNAVTGNLPRSLLIQARK